ncbi:hypothetical protein ACH4FX_36075 [Streptomyces sp. NPDC018019]|uniref:hypothetical protein n=1 Tax=Streptomyces sp. NPDC018019 TaxID=3365030 RepID=UPI0037BD967B
MRDLLEVTDHLDGPGGLKEGERESLLERVREYETAAAQKIEDLRVQLSRAEEFAATLQSRLEQAEAARA